jgi:hypothetical protein
MVLKALFVLMLNKSVHRQPRQHLHFNVRVIINYFQSLLKDIPSSHWIPEPILPDHRLIAETLQPATLLRELPALPGQLITDLLKLPLILTLANILNQ